MAKLKAYDLREWLLQHGVDSDCGLLHVINNVVFQETIRVEELSFGHAFKFITLCDHTGKSIIVFEEAEA